jgi:YVTN family beta-propeller protein
MKNKLLNLPYFQVVFILITVLGISCDDDEAKPETPKITTGVYVLNEGLYNQNNCSLTYYDFTTETPFTDFFQQNNNRGLGDTGNDMKSYGSKIYAVINASSQLEVIDIKTGTSIKQIPMFDANDVPKQPRNIAFHKAYAYVTSYDGTVGKLDTATLEFVNFIEVGRQPEGICVANDKLYVANSGALDYPNYDNTVSVINTSTFQEIKKITVDINLGIIAADADGDVYIISRGNYVDINSSLYCINTVTDEVKKKFDNLEVQNLTTSGDLVYVYNFNYTTFASDIKVIDASNESIIAENFITDGTTISTPYGINVDPANGDVYICDAGNFVVTGDVFCFSTEGVLKFKFEAGLNPNAVVFIQK